jgi:pyruvate-ferredoxin/flavodoxin oxidoreductase
MVCPHAVIRIKAYDEAELENAPSTFKATDARDRDWADMKYTIQVAPEDCTACGICVDVCPAKNKAAVGFKALNMEPQPPLREQEVENWDFFLNIPETPRNMIKTSNIRQQQAQQPLFEFSGACAGCGETPYVKLVTQLFGDRMVVANATGCSSIYGGNLPTTPWTHNEQGFGPAWSNSLFEDNAEFGMGMRVSIDKQSEYARELLYSLRSEVGEAFADSMLNAEQSDESDIHDQRERVVELKAKLEAMPGQTAKRLLDIADYLVKKSMWIIGGDGWAYDIGYGGLDHVLASGRNVNVLVLDTEVYSNTGGQMSKSTPIGAVAKFAAGGKPTGKKDLGMMAMNYGNVYVAQVAMGANDTQTLRAFIEAEAYDGPSLIIAYSHCIAHGINMGTALGNQKAAVQSGHWMLYRYHPEKAEAGENPLSLDSRKPRIPIRDYMYMENRYKMLTKSSPETAQQLLERAQSDADDRWKQYEFLAKHGFAADENED